MDRNRDGRLEAGEIPLRSRAAVGKLAREAGLDLAKPLSIDKLKKQLAKRKQKKEKPGQPGDGKQMAPVQSGDRVAGFGSDSDASSVAGFGAAGQVGRDPSLAAITEDDSKGDKGQADSKPDSRTKDQIRRYASGLLKRYDANKNGVLEKEEWSKLKGNPAESDTDKDGRLSVDELTVRLMNYSRNGKTASKSDGSKSKSKKTKTSKRFSKKVDSRKSYRFLTPTERLAESLPSTLRDWFLRNDKNGDGQIAMSEFATIWSREKAVDFASYDLNNDGVITPQEFLRVKTGVVAKN